MADKFFGNEFGILKDKALSTIEGLKNQYGIDIGDGILKAGGEAWPQTEYDAGLNLLHPAYKTRGFLPPVKISPTANSTQFGTEVLKYGQYTYKDWRGQQLSLNTNTLTSEDRFKEHANIPNNTNLANKPYSTRDTYLIFGDEATDYFRHGLQIIDDASERNDPVMYGFEIIMDDLSSPLLNGSISDFLRNYSNVSEIETKIPVYEDFKQQFIKFFKTKATVAIEETGEKISKMRKSDYPDASGSSDIFRKGRKSYLAYYLKKIEGLENLSEQNTPDTKKFLVDYNKDKITLSFSEDLSLSIGTLAHLYKLLYWSKPNGKSIVPENLLRFNCDIIVSEVRNFNRVRKAVNDGNNLEIIKDNVSRYIYSLKECQFYFNSMSHGGSIDLGSIAAYGEGGYSITFDYKYTTTKLEKFVPTSDGFGKYIGYDGGAIWKLGNKSADTGSVESVPKFFTDGENSLGENGVNSAFLMSIPSDNIEKPTYPTDGTQSTSTRFEDFKTNSIAKAKELKDGIINTVIETSTRELQSYVNTRTAILNKTLNKILNSSGVTGIKPPKNIYTDAAQNSPQRLFYDVRGDLLNFVGNTIGGAIGGGFRGSV